MGPRLFSHGNQCLRGIQVTRMRLFDQNVEIRAIFVRQVLKKTNKFVLTAILEVTVLFRVNFLGTKIIFLW